MPGGALSLAGTAAASASLQACAEQARRQANRHQVLFEGDHHGVKAGEPSPVSSCAQIKP